MAKKSIDLLPKKQPSTIERKINARQEQVCQKIASGMDRVPAWRAVYDPSGEASDAEARARSSIFMKSETVLARIEELRKPLIDKALWTREQSVKTLVNALQVSESKEDVKEIVLVVKELNAMHGFNAPAKVALTDSAGNDIPQVPTILPADKNEIAALYRSLTVIDI